MLYDVDIQMMMTTDVLMGLKPVCVHAYTGEAQDVDALMDFMYMMAVRFHFCR